jgi:hypothetical protein
MGMTLATAATTLPAMLHDTFVADCLVALLLLASFSLSATAKLLAVLLLTKGR